MGWVAFGLLLAWLVGVLTGAMVAAWALHPFLGDEDAPCAEGEENPATPAPGAGEREEGT